MNSTLQKGLVAHVSASSDLHECIMDPHSSDYYTQTVDFYDACSEVYDSLYPDHVIESRAIAAEVAPILHDYGVRRILDASCGPGHDIENFVARGFEADGADVSAEMLSHARRRLNSIGLSKTVLCHTDVRNLDAVVGHNSYDAVLFRGNTLSNLEHQDYERSFQAIARVLTPGGLLYFDFRHGEQHFAKRRRLEFRGVRVDRRKRLFSVSWYVCSHGATLGDTFHLRAPVWEVRLNKWLIPIVRKWTLRISSHYVPKDLVLQTLGATGFDIVREIPNVRGLPYLLTYIAQKRRY